MMAADTIDYQTDPSRYRHWKIERDGDVAYLIMDVDQAGGLGRRQIVEPDAPHGRQPRQPRDGLAVV